MNESPSTRSSLPLSVRGVAFEARALAPLPRSTRARITPMAASPSEGRIAIGHRNRPPTRMATAMSPTRMPHERLPGEVNAGHRPLVKSTTTVAMDAEMRPSVIPPTSAPENRHASTQVPPSLRLSLHPRATNPTQAMATIANVMQAPFRSRSPGTQNSGRTIKPWFHRAVDRHPASDVTLRRASLILAPSAFRYVRGTLE